MTNGQRANRAAANSKRQMNSWFGWRQNERTRGCVRAAAAVAAAAVREGRTQLTCGIRWFIGRPNRSGSVVNFNCCSFPRSTHTLSLSILRLGRPEQEVIGVVVVVRSYADPYRTSRQTRYLAHTHTQRAAKNPSDRLSGCALPANGFVVHCEFARPANAIITTRPVLGGKI